MSKNYVTHGWKYVVRVLRFSDCKTQWAVRVPVQKPRRTAAEWLHSKVAAMMLVRERTRVPVPRVFGYRADGDGDGDGVDNPLGAAFMLTEFLPYNAIVAMDPRRRPGCSRSHRGCIPPERRRHFLSQVAEIQVQLTSLRFPKIGVIVRNASDGTYGIGPFPDIGGPFDTASQYFEAWARHAKYTFPEEVVRKVVGRGPVEEVLKPIQDFPSAVGRLAARLSSSNSGPFPLTHPDLLHTHILVDKEYNVMVPAVMDSPLNFDNNGQPLDAETRECWEERRAYVEMVARAEMDEGADSKLSQTLADARAQDLAYALRSRYERTSYLERWRGRERLDVERALDTKPKNVISTTEVSAKFFGKFAL
ncbi:uncharacterized protein B0T15DRAFT_572511 [Chaetomium strumarium]|uniref:Aminoglycoside phosphotransferase domain-containing protein n=1 Tax=Chaetomium strumarium TaxID=1170767 RepID=A0AAJ0M462_9PEZI|nr:hypothetical protein B0T15DRAFT_572511 [Chaetomium strumarium]